MTREQRQEQNYLIGETKIPKWLKKKIKSEGN